LTELFSKFGAVDSSKIITDRDTGRSKGFGFVEMSSNDEADAAIEKLNGSDLAGRALTVNEARPMEPRTGGGGGFGGGGRGGDRGGDRGGFGGGRGGDRGGDRGGNRW
jgi:cold-inducible RNA-binding protein